MAIIVKTRLVIFLFDSINNGGTLILIKKVYAILLIVISRSWIVSDHNLCAIFDSEFFIKFHLLTKDTKLTWLKNPFPKLNFNDTEVLLISRSVQRKSMVASKSYKHRILHDNIQQHDHFIIWIMVRLKNNMFLTKWCVRVFLIN